MRLRPPPGALRAAWIAAVSLLSATAQAETPTPQAAPPAAEPSPAPAVEPSPEAARAASSGAAEAHEETSVPPRPRIAIATRPPPLHAEYAQYGVALTAEINLNAGAACKDQTKSGFEPCILGSGGGLAIRGGYRSPGPWYFGGAYEFTKMDSSNLYRLGIFQQLRAEMRYLPDIGYRAAPYFTAGIGGVAYGNEWGVETGGALIFGGAGVELEVSRLAVLGIGCVYRPVLLAGWTDTGGHERATAIAQFVGFDFILEVRSEMGRR